MRVIDSFQPTKPNPKPRATRPANRPSVTGARFTKLAAAPAKRHLRWEVIATVTLSPALVGLARLGTVGALLVGVASVVSLVLRLPSRIGLTLALMTLLFMGGLQIANQNALAQTVAIMAYELLAAGVVAFAVEARRDSRFGFRNK